MRIAVKNKRFQKEKRWSREQAREKKKEISRLMLQNVLSYQIFTFTFRHLADAFVQSDVQGREQSS